MKRAVLLVLLTFSILNQLKCQTKDKFEFLSNETCFKSKRKILSFYSDIVKFGNIKDGDIVADIGTYNALLPTCLNLTNPNIIFYIQEYSKQRLNKNRIFQIVKYYKDQTKLELNNDFKFIIGEKQKTNLPDSTFDKIIISNTFEYISNCDLWLADLKSKLKEDGKVIVSTGNNIASRYVISIFERNDFTCTLDKTYKGRNIQIFNNYSKSDRYTDDIFDAIVCRDSARVKQFINSGIDVNTKLGDMNLLSLATAISNNLHVIRLLINNGATYYYDDNQPFYSDVILKSSSNACFDILDLLINQYNNCNLEESLIYAAWLSNDIKTVELLINSGAGITSPGIENDLFARTMEGGSLEIFKLLMSKNNDINIYQTYEDGANLLHLSTMGQNTELLIFMIEELNFDINFIDASGNTVLMYAVANGCIENVKLLIERYKLDPNIKNNHSKKAIDYSFDPEIF
ncbi:MAG: hypothetical protein C0596_10545 [Marinilabiliales bacterium]|nr:MAG: hypothetical protein C0596_10545 [Marinilabiliales bacterium]